MEYKSEIRDSQVNSLFDKVSRQSYSKYLWQIDVKHARAINEQTIRFEFPVTAVIGPNGGGKTTILGAAACAYKPCRPGLFFPKSGAFDPAMQNWAFEYDCVDKSLKQQGYVKRTAKFRSFKWYRDALEREVRYFGVARTVPASERPEMRKCVSGSFSVPAENVSAISANVITAVSRILGKDVTGFSHVKVSPTGRITLLTGMNGQNTYSEFHFGAGESSVIRMAMFLENCSDSALILIEEIENGLHPLATLRMVEYLISLAERKRLQVVFTTHSDDALLPLPSRAIWSVIDGGLQHGKLSVKALRAISGNAGCRLVIYVEDEFSKQWVENILKSNAFEMFGLVEVYYMKGDSVALKTHKAHMDDPAKRQPSICILDGDSSQAEDVANGVFKLPGGAPERYIYDSIVSKLDTEVGKLGIALHQGYGNDSRVMEDITAVGRDTLDHHNLFVKLGEKLGFIPVAVATNAFLTQWTYSYGALSTEFFNKIKPKLPIEDSSPQVLAEEPL